MTEEGAVRGHATVELFDDVTGRLYQREQGENFLSPFLIETVKQYQRNVFGMYFAGTRTLDSVGRQLWNIPPVPLSHIAAWNDSATESPSTERTMKGGLPVAFASRFPQGSPTGKRGVVSVPESTVSATSQTYVFDWVTSNGNGTFQSVGWCNCDSSGNPLSIWPDPYYGSGLAVSISTPTTYYRGGLWHDGTGWLTLHTAGQTSGTSQYAIYRIDETTGVGTLLVTLPSTAFRWQNGSTTVPPNAFDLCMIGTDYYVIGHNILSTASGVTYVAKFNSAGTQQWLVAHDGGASEMPNGVTGLGWCITSDGTDLYVGYGGAAGTTNGTVYKLSASTGLVTGTISVPAALGTNAIVGIAWDGTNLRVVNQASRTATIDLSGNLVSPSIVGYYGVADSGTATSPFSGAYLGASSAMNQAGLQQFNNASAGNAMESMMQSSGYGIALSLPGAVGSVPNGGGCHFKSGKMYIVNGSAALGSSTYTRILEVTNTNLGTRCLLPSPVTKDSSKTMKITYTFTFS